VQGDLQVVQNTVALCDLAEFDPAELLAPYTGDIVAEGVSKVFRSALAFCCTALSASSAMSLKR
jgi:ubiquinone biosynthesis protein UbiJ